MPNLDLDLPGSASSNAGSEKTTDLGILADLELDLEWKVWKKWIGSDP